MFWQIGCPIFQKLIAKAAHRLPVNIGRRTTVDRTAGLRRTKKTALHDGFWAKADRQIPSPTAVGQLRAQCRWFSGPIINPEGGDPFIRTFQIC
jgi:hypothetical protein